MTRTTINGARLWWKETGTGDPVMQIHGAGFGHFNFATATPPLSEHFRVIDFDLRGYGQSEQPLQHYDMEVWADDIAGLMDTLSITKAHTHGTSMGAMIAQQFAAKYPAKVDRLVLNCGAAKLDRAGVLTFRNWIDIAGTMGCGSRTLAELIAVQALSRTFLDGEQGEGAIDMIQDILGRSNRREVLQPIALAGLAVENAVPGVIDEKIVALGELGPQRVETTDYIVAARVQQQRRFEAVLAPQQLVDGARIVDRRLQILHVLVIIDPDDERVVPAELGLRTSGPTARKYPRQYRDKQDQ